MPGGRFPELRDEEIGQDGVGVHSGGWPVVDQRREKRLSFKTNGVDAWMTFQATTQVQKPLAAAKRITESYIQNKQTGQKTPQRIEDGVYMMQMLVKPAPFQGQAK